MVYCFKPKEFGAINVNENRSYKNAKVTIFSC